MGAPSALVETWCLYAVGSLIIFLRIFTRWQTIGIRNWQPDDYLIILSWGTYTTMTVAAHIVGGLGDLHALSMEQRKALTEEQAKSYIYGTQWFCAGVATYILFIWSLKLNLLFLYQRVVRGLWVQKFIKPTMYLVIATFIATYLILFCACRPYNRMWVVYEDQGPLCQPQSFLNMVPPLIMNIVTDLCIMAIPAPVVIPVKTTLWRRIGLLGLFGAGIFVMIAAILRVTMVLVAKNGPTAAIWSCREDFVAIVVGQAILIRPMFTKNFWTGRYSSSNTNFSSGPSKNSKLGGSIEMNSARKGLKSKSRDPFSVTVALATVNEDDHHLQRTSSTDHIFDQSHNRNDASFHNTRDGSISSAELEKGQLDKSNSKYVIHVSKQVRVETEEESPQLLYRPHNVVDRGNDASCWTGAPGMSSSGQQDNHERVSSEKPLSYPPGRAF